MHRQRNRNIVHKRVDAIQRRFAAREKGIGVRARLAVNHGKFYRAVACRAPRVLEQQGERGLALAHAPARRKISLVQGNDRLDVQERCDKSLEIADAPAHLRVPQRRQRENDADVRTCCL